MTETLPVQPWMTHPATRTVIAALEAAGGDGCARFVGGCVRNALLRQPVSDIDIATPLTPDIVTKALTAAGLKAIPTGVDHGTITAVAQGKPFEITTLRRDVETDGRRAVVAFTTDWAEDAQRRDFRRNALYADPAGQIYDPTEGGLADVHAGRIVFVGDAETRIREDGLRDAFLKRDGLLIKKEDGWLLQVERKTLDVLLDKIPWGYSTVSLPWNSYLVFVEW